MTKSPRCASFLRPAKLCRLLLVLACVKLCVMGGLLLDPLAGFFNPAFVSLKEAAGGVRQARAADGAPAGIPPVSASPAPAAPQAPLQPSGQAGTPPSAPGAAAPRAANAPEQTSSMAREALLRKEQDLARKEQDLRTLEKELDDRLERLTLLESRLSLMLKEANEVKEEKFRKLVDMLSNMKARQAASVLETLEEGIAVKVLAGMRGRQSGEILTYVDPGKAARLSEALTRMQLPFE